MIKLSTLLLCVGLAAYVYGQNAVGTGTACQQHRRREESSRNPIGRLIPECDANGDYKGLQCHPPSTNGARFCQCWTKDGDIVTSPSRTTKACECPLAKHSATRTNRVGAYVPQCARDGRFASKQCHSSTGHCWCANTNNGTQIGDKTREHSSLNCSSNSVAAAAASRRRF